MWRARTTAFGVAMAMFGALLAAPVGVPNAGATTPSVMFVSGNTATLPATDRAIVDLIAATGIDVVLADDDSVVAADANGVAGVVISSSVVPSKVGRSFRASATPVLVWEPYLFSEMAMTRTGESNRGESTATQSVAIVRPEHPLAAGVSGVVNVTTAPTGLSWGRVVGQGVAVATVPGASARAAIFVYESGTQMDSLVAPATRVGLFPSFGTGGVLTPEGAALIAAAVGYIVGVDVPDPVNHAPTVDAGSDQTLVASTATDSVDTFVSATVSDDGLPADPGTLSLQWSGPPGVGFATAAAPGSIVTLPEPGTYTLTFEASDGEFTTSDSIVVSVLEPGTVPDNQPPVVDAGADLTVADGSPITVTGAVSDDGLPSIPGAVSLTWSGPAGVTFTSASAASTGVSVPGPGTYVLTLTADDGQSNASDTVTVTVEAVEAVEAGDPGALDILYMAQNATGASAEQMVIQRLIDAGHAVTVVDDHVANPADAELFDLVVVSSSISASTFDDGWDTAPTPIISWQPSVADDLGMTARGTASGFAGLQRDIKILDATHPITVGFDGLVRVTTATRSIAWAEPGGDARILASLKSTESRASIYTYEPGDAMAVGVAPARRVGLFLSTTISQVMTPEGWTLFDRAVTWAGQAPKPAPVAAATADITSGQAPQAVSFDASTSTGSIVSYHWDLGDGTNATGMQVANTYTAGGTFDVVLTVTDDEGRTDSDTVTLAFDSPAPGGGRVEPIAAYDFVQGARPDYVDDVSGIGNPLDLRIHDAANVTWLPGGGLSVDTATKLQSEVPAEKITASVKATQEITIEAWVDPINDRQSGPARIVALTNGDDEANDMNAMLGQGYRNTPGDRIEGRFLTTDTTDHGQPGVVSRGAAIDGDLVHLVFTRNFAGVERLYVNGSISSETHVSGDASGWDLTTPLVLANELGKNNPWRGVFHRVRIFDRAIDAAEVCSNLSDGPGHSVVGNNTPYPCLVSNATPAMVAPRTVQFGSSGSTDLDGTIVSRSWNFGDGGSSSAVAPSRNYTQPGSYEVSLTVTDNQGAARTATITVEIDDPAPPTPPTLTEASGMRVGNGFFKLDVHEAREAWLGRELNWTAQFTSHHSAEEMGSSSNGLFAHRDADLPKVADRMNPVVAVGLAFGFQDLNNGGPAAVRAGLIDTIQGDFDFLYYRTAARIRDAGYGDAVIRLGHEFNAKWPPWAAEGNEDVYIAAFRHVATMFRNVSPDFQFDFSAFKMRFASTAPLAYPGDDYVDIISMSVYWKNENGNNPWRETKWATEYRQNLEDLRNFAIARGKPIGFAEWGIQGLDEPLFVQRMYDFMITLPASGPGHMAYNVYWDSGVATSRLDNLPAVKARYKLLFG